MALFFSACESFQTSGEFAAGRGEFLARKYETALAHFENVIRANPEYVFRSMGFSESAWTYLGRCQYHLNQLGDAKHSLERALAINPEEFAAGIFMGLTRLRAGDDAGGFRELERALKGLHCWIEYENERDPSNAFWDPRREIRIEIAKAIRMISNKDASRQALIERAEWVGRTMEEEIEEARRQESRPCE